MDLKIKGLRRYINIDNGLPDPVIPPDSKLVRFVGRISKIERRLGRNCFAAEHYKTMAKTMEKAERDSKIGALVALLSGNITMAAGAAHSGPKNESEATYIQLEMDGELFRGWLGSCPFNRGDEVEIVAEWQNNHYEIYAMARPRDRMIAMFPNCRWGRFPFYLASLKAGILWGVGIFLVLYSMLLVKGGDNKSYFEAFFYYWWSQGIGAAGVALFISVIGLFIHCKDRIKTTVKLSEQIFTALGWKKIAWVNLYKSTKKRLKQIQKETGEKPNIADFRKKPINRRILDTSFLYYY